MTATLLILVYIVLGIIGANITLFKLKTYSFGLVGNCIIGVFTSILCLKSVGRFITNPWILATGSFIAGAVGVLLFKKLINKLSKES